MRAQNVICYSEIHRKFYTWKSEYTESAATIFTGSMRDSHSQIDTASTCPLIAGPLSSC